MVMGILNSEVSLNREQSVTKVNAFFMLIPAIRGQNHAGVIELLLNTQGRTRIAMMHLIIINH